MENNADSFKEKISEILSSSSLRKNLENKSLETIKKISGEKMEKDELELYKKLI